MPLHHHFHHDSSTPRFYRLRGHQRATTISTTRTCEYKLPRKRWKTGVVLLQNANWLLSAVKKAASSGADATSAFVLSESNILGPRKKAKADYEERIRASSQGEKKVWPAGFTKRKQVRVDHSSSARKVGASQEKNASAKAPHKRTKVTMDDTKGDKELEDEPPRRSVSVLPIPHFNESPPQEKDRGPVVKSSYHRGVSSSSPLPPPLQLNNATLHRVYPGDDAINGPSSPQRRPRWGVTRQGHAPCVAPRQHTPWGGPPPPSVSVPNGVVPAYYQAEIDNLCFMSFLPLLAKTPWNAQFDPTPTIGWHLDAEILGLMHRWDILPSMSGFCLQRFYRLRGHQRAIDETAAATLWGVTLASTDIELLLQTIHDVFEFAEEADTLRNIKPESRQSTILKEMLEMCKLSIVGLLVLAHDLIMVPLQTHLLHMPTIGHM
ncbi:hypothetical protein BGW80DRAFT_1256198 [Lactifluus volemus]|nr:hypothetical protein BGW80DRAFT_1256198 [Lactifluus volemus]